MKLLGFDCKLQACKVYKHKHDIPVINDLFEVFSLCQMNSEKLIMYLLSQDYIILKSPGS